MSVLILVVNLFNTMYATNVPKYILHYIQYMLSLK